jgi:hypothetical protein
MTDSTGCFQVDACVDSCYALAPHKDGDHRDAISPLDAALVMRFMVCLETLDYCPIEPMTMYDGTTECPADTVYPQLVAAETSGSGVITSYDASLILKYIVGQDVSQFLVGQWMFYCDSLSLCPLLGDAEGQDYVGLLCGDVSGNWGPLAPYTGYSEARLAMSDGDGAPGELVEIPVRIEDADGLYGLEFKVRHDPGFATPQSVELGEGVPGRLLEWKKKAGRIHVAIAGAEPILGTGELCRITYQIADDPEGESCLFTCSEARADECENYLTVRDGLLELLPAGVDDPSRSHEFRFCGAVPNPFSKTTTIRFELGESRRVTVSVLDVQGRLVRRLTDRAMTAGPQDVVWDGCDQFGNQVPAGVFFVRISAGDWNRTGKIVLAR